jgi:hypothetical protein
MAASACGHPSRLAEDGEHLRMTAVQVAMVFNGKKLPGHYGQQDLSADAAARRSHI